MAVEVRWGAVPGPQVAAAVDFAAAAAAGAGGAAVLGRGDGRVPLVAASIAEGVPVDLREAALCLDAASATRAARAVCHAAGRGAGPGREPGW